MTICKDCLDENGVEMPGQGKVYPLHLKPRPIVERSGGRCATHWRKALKERSARAHAARIEKVYGLGRDQYEKLYEAQGGRCYICRRATGKTRRLSVDHDHKSGYVRGLLCRPCNSLLGHIRDDTLVARRIIWYLNNPPAWQVLGRVKPCE